MKNSLNDLFLLFCGLLLSACVSHQNASHANKSILLPTTQETAVKNEVLQEDPLITVLQSSMSAKIVNRSPVDPKSLFQDSIKKVFFYTQVQRTHDTPSFIKHIWHHEGAPIAQVKLPLKAFHWRTYSSKTITPEMTGKWHVDVISADGKLIDQEHFVIQKSH